MNSAATIELKLTRVAQLFHTLDPSPFRAGDLDREAEAYIVESAEEHPKDAKLSIMLRLPPEEPADEAVLGPLVRGYFGHRATAETQAMRQLFHDGRTALAIGVVILAACLAVAGGASASLNEGQFSRIVQESFVILGWVAIWRPSEMFLYDWVPMARRRRLYRRLAAAEVTVREPA